MKWFLIIFGDRPDLTGGPLITVVPGVWLPSHLRNLTRSTPCRQGWSTDKMFLPVTTPNSSLSLDTVSRELRSGSLWGCLLTVPRNFLHLVTHNLSIIQLIRFSYIWIKHQCPGTVTVVTQCRYRKLWEVKRKKILVRVVHWKSIIKSKGL